MWAFLSSLLTALPTAAKSNASLLAFAIAVAAYTATVWRVSRNKQLLANLQKFSAKDRLAALELEMGGVRLASGISPEQWVRSRIHRYYFVAFAITLILATFYASLLFIYRDGTADISVDLKQSLREHPLSTVSTFIMPSARAQDISDSDANNDDRTLHYDYKKQGKLITISPKLEYLDAQRRGDPVVGFSWWNDPFAWAFPTLAVKVVNNTRHDLVLSEVVFHVRKSSLDVRPVFAVVGPSYHGRVKIVNEGWGGIADASVKAAIKSADNCKNFSLESASAIPLGKSNDSWPSNVVTENGGVQFSIDKLVPDSLIDSSKQCTDGISEMCSTNGMCEGPIGNIKCLDKKPRDVCRKVDHMPPADELKKFKSEASEFSKDKNPGIFFKRDCSDTPICVHGQLDYTDGTGRKGTLRFSTISILEEPGAGAPMPPSYEYDALLQAGKSDYTQRLSISQQIKSGEGDNFSLRIATDKSASFDFDMDILSADGSVAWSGSFLLSLFVPTSGSDRAKQSFGIVKNASYSPTIRP